MVRVSRGFRNQGMVRRGASEVVSFHRVCRAIPNRGGEIMLIRSKFSGYQNGIRTHNKGGGGGGSVYYANQDKLLGVQADIAQGIYNNIYQPYAPGATADLNAMRTEDLATKARNTAGADAGQAMGQGIDAVNRNMARYGLDPHKFASDSNVVALGGAANKVNAMNQASQWGEGQKWGRTYDFYNALSGIPSNASASLGSAAAGYGAMGRAVQDSDNADAAGWGKAGGMVGSALFSKDGGMVRKPCAARMAAGGLMQLPNWREQSTAGSRYAKPASAAQSFLASAATGAAASALKGAGSRALQQGFRSITSQAPSPVVSGSPVPAGETTSDVAQAYPVVDTQAGVTTQGVEAGKDAATATTATTDSAASLGPYGAVVSGVINMANGQDAGQAVGNAAGGYAGAQAGATAGSVVGPVGTVVGGLVGGMLGGSLFMDGGSVRKNMEAGGKVSGPGGPREDKVPAWLSDGEYVLPAKTVKAMGGAAALDPVVKATNDGREPMPRMEGGTAKAASGGLGVALGAGVDEYTRQRVLQDQRNARAEDVAWRNARAAEEDKRWTTADARAAAVHGIQMEQGQRQQKQQKARDDLMDSARQLDAFNGEISKLDPNAPVPMDFVERAAKFYNEHPTMQNGMQASIQQIDGKPMMVHGVPGRSDAQILPITKDTLMAGSKEAGNLLIRNLAMTSPEGFEAYAKAQSASAQEAAKIASQEKIAAGNNAVQRDGHILTHEVGMLNARAHDRSAAASAALHGIQANAAQLTLDQSKLANEARIAQAEGKELSPAQKAALSYGATDGKVHSVVKGGNGNWHMMMSNGTSRDTNIKVEGALTEDKALAIAAKVAFPGTKTADIKAAAKELMGNANQPAALSVGTQRVVNGKQYEWDGNLWKQINGPAVSGAIK